MSSRSKKVRRDTEREREDGDVDVPFMKPETVRSVVAVSLFVASLFLSLAAFGKAGMAGEWLYLKMYFLLGIGYFLLPVVGTLTSISLIQAADRAFARYKIAGSIIFFAAGMGTINLASREHSGVVGSVIASPLVRLFDAYVSALFLAALLAISLLILFDARIMPFPFAWIRERVRSFRATRRAEEEEGDSGSRDRDPGLPSFADEDMADTTGREDAPADKQQPADTIAYESSAVAAPTTRDKSAQSRATSEGGFFLPPSLALHVQFSPPPLALLEIDRGKPSVGDVKANTNIIKRTLQNFGITVEMDEVSIGPSVTRYALKPAEGVKLSRIVGLKNDLALALAAHPLRIEAPIPGKSLVGIEIPNMTKTIIGLGSLLSTHEFIKSEKPLLVALGKSITGKSHFGDLSRMPHLLIAGATGSGKSVAIHAIITSLLYRNSPENLGFIMVDPKRVELTLYNNIPHLLKPVITHAKETIHVLKQVAQEMDRRYDVLEAESVRDIESYHRNVFAPALQKAQGENTSDDGELDPKFPERMPYIVVVIDELADIMQAYPRELESAVVRLAQMSRAVGIHLILSTQRPSVNVLTGLIKANIPARIALQVASQVDSRTILDTGGAETLLGAGDMLYISGDMSKPLRLQSAFISEGEVKSVVKHLIDHYDNAPIGSDSLVTSVPTPERLIFEDALVEQQDAMEDDPLYAEARDTVIRAGKASTSYLQRKLRIGYSRAARLIDVLEEQGVIGPGDGSKPRLVLGYEDERVDNADDFGDGDFPTREEEHHAEHAL